MTDPRLLALLHAELDGDLDAAGRAELTSHLATDPELARLRAELAAVDAGLAALPAESVLEVSLNWSTACCEEQLGWSSGMSQTRRSRPSR